MDKELIIDMFDSMCATNTKIIMSGKKVAPCIVFITKDMFSKKGEAKVIPLDIDTNAKKELLKKHIKDAVLKHTGVIGYIMVYDSIATFADKNLVKRSSTECCMRTLYTATDKKCSMQFHDGEKLGKLQIVTGRSKQSDTWDCWNQGDIEKILRVKL